MQYIFLDESGQFHKNDHESFFVIGSFVTANPRLLAKRFLTWKQSKFPKKLRHQCEIKFSDRGINLELRKKTLRYLASLDVRIRYSFLKTENIPTDYHQEGKIMTGQLYTHVVGETLASYFPQSELEYSIICDHRHLKDFRKSEYLSLLRTRLLPLLPANAKLSIQMVDSTSNINIQIADWIASSIAVYLNEKAGGEEYFSILKKNILGKGFEFFPNL